MDTVMQLRQGPRCRGSHAASFTGAGAARPILALAASAISRPKKLQQRACRGQPAAAAASAGKPRAAPARAVADSALGASRASPTSVQVGGKMLLQNFAGSGDSQLRLSLQLVSATVAGPDGRGVKGEEAVLDAVVGVETELDVTLTWDDALGAPGAVVVKNHSDFPVYLKLLSLPAATAGPVYFACNGWVYPVAKHPYRLFFTNDAAEEGRLYAVDHHDWVMPYLKRINELPGDEEKGEVSQRKAYAARTLLFLNDDSTLKPLAIELSSPHPENEQLGAVSTVYTPPDTEDRTADRFTTWELAKVYAAANDACANNFVSHWLNTHASMEPFVIAANRQLSVLHPIHRLLKPHFRKTLHINAVARQIVVGSGDRRNNGDIFRGIHEVAYFPSKYNMEMSSKAYRAWNFTELALPNDLIKRGLAKGEPKDPENLELLIKDYPYAVDGLDIWIATKKWVSDYCAIYYADYGAVATDSELQAWWSEIRNVGHGDLRDAEWWPAMNCLSDLVETCTTIIWLGSAYHAAVSFGQYDYQGFVPNSPALTTRPMPEAGAEVTESDFLGSIKPMTEALAFMAISMGPMALAGEVYLGQRPDTERWTSEQRAAEALARFQARLKAVAENIERRNADPALKNRSGPVEVPYTLLAPTATPGPVVRGIPNSVTV